MSMCLITVTTNTSHTPIARFVVDEAEAESARKDPAFAGFDTHTQRLQSLEEARILAQQHGSGFGHADQVRAILDSHGRARRCDRA